MNITDSASATTEVDAPRPVAEHERIETIDVLRGIALFGVLMVNMAFFSFPLMLAVSDPSRADWPMTEHFAFYFIKILFEYKFISLFSLLFGIGFAVQLMRARERGTPFAGRFLRRLAILFCFGAIHAAALWYGDILVFYAFSGLILLLCAGLSVRGLLIASGAFLVCAIVFGTGFMLLQHVGGTMGAESIAASYEEGRQLVADGEAPTGFDAIMKAHFDPNNPIWLHAEQIAYRDGPTGDAAAFRLVTYGFAIVINIVHQGWHVLAMFMLGAALMKARFFTPERADWHRRLVLIALPIGLVLEIAYTLLFTRGGLSAALAVPLHEVGSVLMMLGYVGGITIIVQRGGLRPLFGPIAQAGRMALTVYLGSTILTTGVMYWWGLGWFGDVSRFGQIGVAIGVFTSLMLFSVLWLRFFRFGPLEWLWRSLTYLRPQPLLR